MQTVILRAELRIQLLFKVLPKFSFETFGLQSCVPQDGMRAHIGLFLRFGIWSSFNFIIHTSVFSKFSIENIFIIRENKK